MNEQKKNYRPLPNYDRLVEKWLKNYDAANYEFGLSAAILRNTHALLERPFGPDVNFPLVLEIGAGTLAHLRVIRHQFERYVASDFDQTVLDMAARQPLPEGVELRRLDGSTLPFEGNSFDRLIATHVLEHLPFPHLAVEEWVRVVKPGGTISVILPCDPGWAWRFGRHFGPRRRAEASGLPYDYYMAREHINSIFNLWEILKFHFPKRDVTWWPLRLPLPNCNLIFVGNFYV